MTAALTLMVIFAISFTFVRIAAVALRITGMSEGQARFQALSALTGTGFTTTEAELVVNYPVRRKIISNLMIIGNLGLVSVVSTLMISFLRTDADAVAVFGQLIWILAGVGGLCLVMLHPYTDKVICGLIDRLLRRYTRLGKRRYVRLLQVGNGLSIAEHQISNIEHSTIDSILRTVPNLSFIAIKHASGAVSQTYAENHELLAGDSCILIGRDEDHESLSKERVPGAVT